MSASFDRDSWERRWARALRDNAHAVENRPPNAYLRAEAADRRPGRALDAGAGHGAEAIWLAQQGWKVTAVDFAVTALEHGRAAAERLGADVAGRIEWVEADLGTWSPEPGSYDLVNCLYVHVEGSVPEMVGRLAAAVAPDGILLMVGHRPVDPVTGAPTPAARQTQISVAEAVEALDPSGWEILTAEDRPRPKAGTGVDAVIRARRRA